MGERISVLPTNEQEKADFRMKLDVLVGETVPLSGNYLKHPEAKPVLNHGKEALPWLLEYLRESVVEDSDKTPCLNPWVAFEVIYTIVPPEELPLIPEHTLGKLSVLLNIFDSWGVERGHIPPKDQ